MKRLLGDICHNFVPLFIVFGLWLLFGLLFDHFRPVVLLCGFPCPGCGLTRAFFRDSEDSSDRGF